jgi:hypothetical protein
MRTTSARLLTICNSEVTVRSRSVPPWIPAPVLV